MLPSTTPIHKLPGITFLANAHPDFALVFQALGGSPVGGGLFDGNPPSSLESLLSGTTEGLLQDAISRADLICVDVGHGTGHAIEDATTLVSRLFPNTFPRDTRHVLVDLAAAGEDIHPAHLQALLALSESLQSHAEVTLALAPGTRPGNGQSLRSLRQQLGVSEVLLLDSQTLASSTGKGDSQCALESGEKDVPCPTVLATYAATQFLNLPQESRLHFAAKAGQLHLSGGSAPSWIEIQS